MVKLDLLGVTTSHSSRGFLRFASWPFRSPIRGWDRIVLGLLLLLLHLNDLCLDRVHDVCGLESSCGVRALTAMNGRFFIQVGLLETSQLHHLLRHGLIVIHWQKLVLSVLLMQIRFNPLARFARLRLVSKVARRPVLLHCLVPFAEILFWELAFHYGAMEHITVSIHDHLLMQWLRILHNHCIGLRLLFNGAISD